MKLINPMLENSALVSIKSGKLQSMEFKFNADKNKASGDLKMIYNGLSFSVINPETFSSDALKEKITSKFLNITIIESNPLPGDSLRRGIINYKRDPERFVLNYSFKAIMSGIKSILLKNKKQKNE